MSDDLAIRAEHLGKRYRLRQQGGVGGLVDGLGRQMRRLAGQDVAAPPSHFWALDDVSFNIRKGEVVGIIGHNGAGKSTLLKTLTRITSPTRGSARVWGRVGMLLEVGTGFHADLSGRENVFMNGAILGMTQSEIRRKYDDIVAFAELEDFMDLAIRHYSNGMCLRLALSVAVHLDAEVIFLDEIWAVGDLGFQTKSWRRIEELTGSDRTFVIVAHNLDSIERLCGRCLLMDHGRLTMDGKPADVIARYREELRQRTSRIAAAGQSLCLEVAEARLVSEEVYAGEYIDCRLTLRADADGAVGAALTLRDDTGAVIAAGAASDQQRWTMLAVAPGRNRFRCALPAVFAPGCNYQLVLELRTDQGLAAVSELPFTVLGRDLVLVDEAGSELPVPAVAMTWQRDGDEV